MFGLAMIPMVYWAAYDRYAAKRLVYIEADAHRAGIRCVRKFMSGKLKKLPVYAY